MRKIRLFMTCLCLCGLMLPMAAQERTDADRARRMEEMTDKRVEKLADEFGLKDETRTTFVSLYKNYQQDVRRHRLAEMQPQENAAKKESDMTDEEAAARIQAEFDRKAQSIVDAYNRLETEKKYYEEFSKMLTPKQLMKIFAPMNNPRGTRGAQPRNGRNGDRQGGRGFGDMPGGFGGDSDW